mmetsp:Transcript_28645/g.73147  ORF Transcript_28645/g.73147 Transcript_28645/m.73147 type:complete len:92 (+) Transcript_28645:256-531(+)
MPLSFQCDVCFFLLLPILLLLFAVVGVNIATVAATSKLALSFVFLLLLLSSLLFLFFCVVAAAVVFSFFHYMNEEWEWRVILLSSTFIVTP